MNSRRLGRTEIEISPIGLGCWQFSQGKGLTGSMWAVLDQGTIDAVVGKALEGGINWFDTAEGYGNGQSELTLGTALRSLKVEPGKVVVATKWLPLLRTAANIPQGHSCLYRHGALSQQGGSGGCLTGALRVDNKLKPEGGQMCCRYRRFTHKKVTRERIAARGPVPSSRLELGPGTGSANHQIERAQ